MYRCVFLFFCICGYAAAEKNNILLICIDDLRPELKSFGADSIHSPNIHKLAKNKKAYPPSMPEWFRQNGYTTVSIGNVSHHPGGRGGSDWDDGSKNEMPEVWNKFGRLNSNLM